MERKVEREVESRGDRDVRKGKCKGLERKETKPQSGASNKRQVTGEE